MSIVDARSVKSTKRHLNPPNRYSVLLQACLDNDQLTVGALAATILVTCEPWPSVSATTLLVGLKVTFHKYLIMFGYGVISVLPQSQARVPNRNAGVLSRETKRVRFVKVQLIAHAGQQYRRSFW